MSTVITDRPETHDWSPVNPTATPTPDAFADRMLAALNGAATVLMVSLGHRTGLFDAMHDGVPRSSAALASAAGLTERYVREWLGAMTVSGIVEHDPVTGRYRLPPSHAALLSRHNTDNLAVFAQYIPVLGAVEDDIVRCVRDGGGVPYERYGRFHEVMAEDSAQTVVAALNEHILPLVPGLVGRLEAGIDVLDLGCGRGRALLAMAARFPSSRFHGWDLSPAVVSAAQAEAEANGLANVRFAVRDLADFDRTATPEAFDLAMTFDAVHDHPRPDALLRGIRRTVRSDGVYLMQDIHASSHHHGDLAHPLGPLLYAISCLHCTSVSLAQGGAGLGAMWGRERALSMLREAGFGDVAVHRLPHDVQNDYFVARR